MAIKAAALTAPKTIEISEYEAQKPAPHEVVIRPEYVGICGSDIHFFEFGSIGKCKVTYPFVLGHECSGKVIKIGKDVKNLKIGDRVVIEPGIPCGSCEFCRKGRYNLCPEVKFLSTPPYDGVLKSEFNHPENLTYRLPDNVSTLEGALIEPLAVGLYASKRGAVQPGMSVAILGGGCIGLMMLLACKAAGASQIVISDLFDNRLQKAMELGATGTFNPRTDGNANDMRQKFTDNKGFDIVFETAGNKVTASQTSELVRRGGTIVMVGNVVDEVQFSFRNLYLNEAEIKAVFRYKNIFSEAITQIASGRIKVKEVVSDVFSFENTQSAFLKAMNDKDNVVKAVIKF